MKNVHMGKNDPYIKKAPKLGVTIVELGPQCLFTMTLTTTPRVLRKVKLKLNKCTEWIFVRKTCFFLTINVRLKPLRTFLHTTFRRCPWCNGYRRRKWTRRHEFKSWTTLTALHIALIPLGNPIILPPAIGKIVVQTRFFSLGETTSLREGKL